jgi:hypothetical protein
MDAGRARGVETLGDARCLRSAAVPEKHPRPRKMGLDIPASHDREGNMHGPRFNSKSISDPNPNSQRYRSPICEAPRRRRGISPRTGMYSAWERCPHVKSIHVLRRGRAPRKPECLRSSAHPLATRLVDPCGSTCGLRRVYEKFWSTITAA